MGEAAEATQGERRLLGYRVKKWRGGKVISEREFPPTNEGRRAAFRVKASFKKKRPGRGLGSQAQDCNVIPMYESPEVNQ
jgi:hypothetical protein